MMNNEHNNFLVDILSILPNKVECLIQAPSLENLTIQKKTKKSKYDYYNLINLTEENKKDFIDEELNNSIGNFIQNIQIRKGDSLLFEGYDGVEYGVISKHLIIPDWFIKKYVPDTCTISNEW
ncbi:hypothetical protein SAMN02927937_02006 [Paenimyroides aquimaris]|uniref:Uncharacterized protein n=1 Tax=Paenimyroides marinum TaxID=1159016 RepID=A0A1H6LTQ2_9FLAO|nr:hypothetical protein [Paenimyroides aquimaris]SEH89699.1 hypothetical protein SAMN02927937_02006 [Paenimyroides aquimaris]